MTVTPDTIRTIIRNAGKLPPDQIARACGVTPGTVLRIAREQHVDLRLPTERHDEPRPIRRARAASPHSVPPKLVDLHVRLDPGDLDEILSAGAAFGLSRGEAIRRVLGNACDRGIVGDLVRLPAPIRGNE